MGEFELIERYFKRPPQRAQVGVGDDCAIWMPTPGQALAISSDMLVEGRHFLSTVDPAALGHKALAVNLSDLAACGATPCAFTLALARRAVAVEEIAEEFLNGAARGQLRHIRRIRAPSARRDILGGGDIHHRRQQFPRERREAFRREAIQSKTRRRQPHKSRPLRCQSLRRELDRRQP